MENKIENDVLRITFFGNCGTIYSIIWHNDGDEDKLSLIIGEWIYPFNDDNISILVSDVFELCGNAFLDDEDIFKVVISDVEMESLSTTPN